MIQKLAKQRQDSIDSYRQGGREDLVEKVRRGGEGLGGKAQGEKGGKGERGKGRQGGEGGAGGRTASRPSSVFRS